MLHEETDKFKIEKWVRQGDLPFTAALEEVFITLEWEEKGLQINVEYISHLRSADDIVLSAAEAENLTKTIQELNWAGQNIGLRINLTKKSKK